MTELLIGASLIAAFIAGLAALFAPCCITVLLPAYFGSIFRQKKTIFLMTFIFFLGVLAVFLPIGLGIGILGEFFAQFHNQLFIAGGIFLIFLSASILLGMHFSLPFSIQQKNSKVTGIASVFGLGIFSGFATLCCAPVLAGVMALSILPGSMFWGAMFSIAYVLGMVIPLFILSIFLDKTNVQEKLKSLRKRIQFSLAGKEINISLAEFISAITFFLMGLLILYLAFTNQLAMQASDYQLSINILMQGVNEFIAQKLAVVPQILWIGAIIAVLLIVIFFAIKKFSKKEETQ
ncbi:MAG: cytochrome c biogenesis protein CcdA [archaeon]|nr:cytochrome c biogenesis protein CcdA [archaeon]